jgi:hypothetical protein
VDDASAQASRRLVNARHEREMRADLEGVAVEMHEHLWEPPPLTGDEIDWLVGLSTFVAMARTPVERDSYHPDVIEVMPEHEAPARLAATLAALYDGLRSIGVDDDEARRLVFKLGWDCIPAMRGATLVALHETRGALAVKAVMDATRMPRTTCSRTLEDLKLLALVDSFTAGDHRTSEWSWHLLDSARALWPSASLDQRSQGSYPTLTTPTTTSLDKGEERHEQ